MTHKAYSDLRESTRSDEHRVGGVAVTARIPMPLRGTQAPLRLFALVSEVNCAG